jgi:DNA polymerase III delta prime subunit
MTHSFPIQSFDQLHHAYILEGDVSAAREALFSFIKDECEITPGHPDLFLLTADTLNVEDARTLGDMNSRKPVYGKKFIVAEFFGITVNTQQALLKTLEEPSPNTYIFLITPTASVFLPTVMSRVHTLPFTGSTSASGATDGFNAYEFAAEFISAAPAARLEAVKKIIAEKEKEKIGDAEIFQFVKEVEQLAHAKLGDKEKMKPFLVVDEYVRDTSSSKKMLLEYLALTLPAIRE